MKRTFKLKTLVALVAVMMGIALVPNVNAASSIAAAKYVNYYENGNTAASNLEIVYSNLSDEQIEKIKNVLDKMGYNPSFINIKEIKELAVKETYILEKQKKIEFSEAAFIVLSQRI